MKIWHVISMPETKIVAILKTTLSFEKLLSKQKRKRCGDGVGRPQNAFVLYRKDVQARFNSEGNLRQLRLCSIDMSIFLTLHGKLHMQHYGLLFHMLLMILWKSH
jgi:hypothetical protein